MDVLLVEDDVRVASALGQVLRRRGYRVQCAVTVEEALAASPVELVVLDMSLPDGDGLTVCRALRQRDAAVSIIVGSARCEERDRVAGLRSGADDYLVKPFSMAELQARIEAVMRRATRPSAMPDHLRLGRLEVEVTRRQVHVSGTAVHLTRKEFDLLLALSRQAGTAVSRRDLIQTVWNTDVGGERTLEVHVASLRSKLGDSRLVRTVHGVGYQLTTS